MERYAYIPNYAYMSEQLDGWVKRFETEIAPLLRKG
jgi:putative spermidine/putrescine transport system substrate-binding protein